MRLCEVLGSITATVKHPAFSGRKLLVVRPVNAEGDALGATFLAVDNVQAGPGDRVLVMSEGTGVRQLLGQDAAAIRSVIVAIVDAVLA